MGCFFFFFSNLLLAKNWLLITIKVLLLNFQIDHIPGLNYRIQGYLFTSHYIRIASIVLCLIVQNMRTHVNEVDQSGPEFYSGSQFRMTTQLDNYF